MKNLFSWRLLPSEADFSNLWENATFVFDTNFLLDLYRVSRPTVEDFLKILEHLHRQNRIWLPYQVADEFLRRREKEIDLEAASFKKALSELDRWKSEQQKFKSLRANLAQAGRIVAAEVEDLFDKQKNYFDAVDEVEKVFQEKIKELANSHFPFDADNDIILERLLLIFDSKVGNPYDKQSLQSLYKEAEDRYKKLQPPGFMDAKEKEDERKYGDFILWKQILTFAERESLLIVFVTGEKKEDWWIKKNGEIVAPHIELRREFQEYVKQPFWMYRTQRFIEMAKDKLMVEIDPRSIEETNTIADADLSDEKENEAIKEAIEQLIEQAKPEYSTLKMAKKLVEQAKPEYSTLKMAKKLVEQAKPEYSTLEMAKKLVEQTKPLYSTLEMAKKLVEQTKPLYSTSDIAKLIEQTKPQFPTSDMEKLIEQMRPAFTNSDMEKLIEQMRPAFTNSDMEKLIEQMRKTYR
ncbi:PIN domain-containing protein [Dolichospermum lemmermannii CS-548]|uniref:PIN-like domain-containing protein n=1 Tax=Dolichospermum lemmermannii TaxID=54295 RepID=UPI00233100A0|nr:PIN-like domain-containing protein [Dolichospermum lemmermannii]MDB9436240.1 PIN domain-containing protein [Dolichospermum lemmermannii CS-548]